MSSAEETPMLEGHISRAFDGALAALHIRVVEMGGLVLDQVREAARAYTDWDAHAAEHVIDRSAIVLAYDARIDQDEFTLIARRQPVSRDLRAVFAMAKSVAELERAGGEARKIARTVLQQNGRPARATSADVRQLAHLAASLLRSALESLDRIDGELAAQVVQRDHELDEEYAAGLRRLLTHAMEDPRHLEVAMEAAFVLKALERIGDHARLIARQVQSMVPELDRHAPGAESPREGDPPSPAGSPGSVSSGA
ncbi:MAG TPA: phosphate signaling complex protein PhoU [Steroidobacteraceae bacterium]|nr:phosphate signaling complex protein PhoU [Steroidobacteraceae bacterium]